MQNLQQVAQQILDQQDAITWSQAKSGGKGGQHVNKTRSKAELYFAIPQSTLLTEQQKKTLLKQLSTSHNGSIKITTDSRRSLHQNKAHCERKFIAIITEALTPQKTRNNTIPRHMAQKIQATKKRIKQHQSQKKALRKRPNKGDID